MIDDIYKNVYNSKYREQLEMWEKTSEEPSPLIDADFSIFCQTKMKNGEPFLEDLKERYPDFVPQLDKDFIDCFFDYIKNECPDFSELLEIFLITNTECLIDCNVMKILLSNVPLFLNHIYVALKYGGQPAIDKFDFDCGFYLITCHASEPSFQLLISQILQLTITQICFYDLPFQIPFTIEELFGEGQFDGAEFGAIDLVTMLLESNDNEVVINTIRALKIAFENNDQSKVILGYLFMKYFDGFIYDRVFSEEAVFAFSAGIDKIPNTNPDQIKDITENLLENDDDNLINSGLKLTDQILNIGSDEWMKKKDIYASILNIFDETNIIPLVFRIAQDGSYKLKVSSLQIINEMINSSKPKDYDIFIENGIFQMLSEAFSDEPVDSSVDRDIILAYINILKNLISKSILAQIPNEDRVQMLDLFEYFKVLQLNEDEIIAKTAEEAYKYLLPYLSDFIFGEDENENKDENI